MSAHTNELPARRLLFVSHANPEDNPFAGWLSLQLANAGYEVWCDVTELLGGERFWNDIAEAIDTFAFRVLFVSSLASNRKGGTLRELEIAFDTQEKHGLSDFVVPLKVDELPFADAHERIRDLNFVRFDQNWASGLAQLLKLLEREEVPRSPASGPSCVAQWHRRTISSDRQVVVQDENYYSNWFKLRLPRHLNFYRPESVPASDGGPATRFPWPHRMHDGQLASFATTPEVRRWLERTDAAPDYTELQTIDFVQDGSERLKIAPFDASNIVSDLVRQAWDLTMTDRGLRRYQLASRMDAWYFPEGHLPKNRAYFETRAGKRTYRQLVGRKSKKTLDGPRIPDGFWHYAVSASPQLQPSPRIVLRHHVLFTDDGERPWPNPDRMHRARRSVCKNWWNAAWRDRLFAFCAQISGGDAEIALPVGGTTVRLSMRPMNFESPWTYFEDGEAELDESIEVDLVEEVDDDEAPI